MSDEQKVDLHVYDVPVEVKNKYISMAKLDYDNEMWKVLEAGMERLQEDRKTRVPELEEKVNGLQKQIIYLKTRIEELEGNDVKEKEDKGPKTFGNMKEKDDEEILDRYSTTQ